MGGLVYLLLKLYLSKDHGDEQSAARTQGSGGRLFDKSSL